MNLFLKGFIPPKISFLNKTIKIDWSLTYLRALSKPLILQASVANLNTNSKLDIAASVKIINTGIVKSVTYATVQNSQIQTIEFSYTPVVGEIPLFTIRATDSSLNETTVQNLNTVQICNCTSVDTSATCLNTSQSSYNPNVDLLACQCSNSYTGAFCSELKNFCAIIPCSQSQTCHNKLPALQTTGSEYVCCNAGFTFVSSTGSCVQSKYCTFQIFPI